MSFRFPFGRQRREALIVAGGAKYRRALAPVQDRQDHAQVPKVRFIDDDQIEITGLEWQGLPRFLQGGAPNG